MDIKFLSGLYNEKSDAGNWYREEQLKQLHEYIETERKKADIARTKFFTPDYTTIDAYNASLQKFREKFVNMLGWPLSGYSDHMKTPVPSIEFVTEDDLGKIYRLNIDIMCGLTTYGILFLPKKEGPHPLIISQHGGEGTPELCSGFFGSENYNDMTRRVLKKGFAVFAPQLLLWRNEFGPAFNRHQIDCSLKQLGGSITALEIFKIKRSIDYLATRDDIDKNRIGMIGLSYGGFYTLFTAACDLRIKAVLSSCFFNNRFKYDWLDWTWFNSGNTFLDAEICSLICPRPLFIEVGKNDELFDISYVGKEYKKVLKVYKKLSLTDHLKYKEVDGTHELDKSDEGIEFLCSSVIGTGKNSDFLL
jgi:hypothetical protein